MAPEQESFHLRFVSREPGSAPESWLKIRSWVRMTKKVRWLFDVDIVGRCNLRCPSCPVGNSTEVP